MPHTHYLRNAQNLDQTIIFTSVAGIGDRLGTPADWAGKKNSSEREERSQTHLNSGIDSRGSVYLPEENWSVFFSTFFLYV